MNDRIKLLFLSAKSACTGDAYTHRLKKLAEGLRSLGAETDFLYLRDLPFSKPHLAQPLNLPFVQRQVKGYDFIHAGDDAAFAATLWKRLMTTSIIFDVHGDSLSETRLGWQTAKGLRPLFYLFQAWMMTFIAVRGSDAFLVVSRPLKELLLQKGVSSSRIYFVRNGVDTELFHPLTDKLVSNTTFTVCYAGQFQYWQATDALIQAAYQLRCENIKFKFIGFDSTDEPLKRKIVGELGEKAELVNRMPQAELVKNLALSDVLIIPRRRHPATVVAFPTKFAEYIALGRPVIVSDVDETASMVREHNCGLVASPTAEGLAEAIFRAKNIAPQELGTMGRNGRQLAEEVFSWNVICRNYINILQELRGSQARKN